MKNMVYIILLFVSKLFLNPVYAAVTLEPGAFSSVAALDLNDDGKREIVAFVSDKSSFKSEIRIYWGDSPNFSDFFAHKIVVDSTPRALGRDTSSSVIEIKDVNKDGKLDVITASGVLFNLGSKNFSWLPLPEALHHVLMPVSVIEKKEKIILLRASKGTVEMCTFNKESNQFHCKKLDPTVKGFPLCEDITKESTDIAVGDFDHDGTVDILIGCSYSSMLPPHFKPFARMWRGGNNWNKAEVVIGLDSSDWEIGDMNEDGFPDVVAQKMENIPDFPSFSEVWLSGKGGFVLTQKFMNHDNHNDRATLADFDKDGCLDYLQIGVDNPHVGLKRGLKDKAGNCKGKFEENWTLIKASSGVGVQFIDVISDSEPELIIQTTTMPVNEFGKLLIFNQKELSISQ